MKISIHEETDRFSDTDIYIIFESVGTIHLYESDLEELKRAIEEFERGLEK